jgi:superfamily II DNA/RNA helicase
MTGADILVNAMTGSGKTAAFMLPILERLLYRYVQLYIRWHRFFSLLLFPDMPPSPPPMPCL